MLASACWCVANNALAGACVQGLEGKVLELRTELRSALAAADRQVLQPPEEVL
jgi:hypothetical protein